MITNSTYATMSVTSFVVGPIAVLKKLITTELNRSLSCGYLLNACCEPRLINMTALSQVHRQTYDFGKQLSKNPDKLIIDQLTALQAGLFDTLDLLLHDDLKGCGAHEQRGGRALNDRYEKS